MEIETGGLYVHSPDNRPTTKMHLLRKLVTEKMTTALREIMAVVETTVVGYESEVSLLKLEVDHLKRQLEKYKTDAAVTNESREKQSMDITRLEHKDTGNKDHPTSNHKSTWGNEVDSVPTNTQVSQQEMVSSEHDDGDCPLEDLPTDSPEACHSNTGGCHSDDKINDIQNKDCKMKRMKRLPRKYKSNLMTNDNDWETDQNEKLQAFYIQLKDHKDICDTLTNTPTTSHDDNKPSISSCGSLDEQPSETGEICKLDAADNMSSADSAAQSEEDEEDDHDRSINWKPEQTQNCTDKSRECQVCGTSLRSRAVLTKHALSHVYNPEGCCGVCGQQFQSSEELRCHLGTHQKLHQCDECGQVFITKGALQNHFDAHGRERPFKCQMCPNAFYYEDDLKRHELDHKDKPYKCDTCPKSFWYKLQLDVHNQTHTGKKLFCCDICGKFLSDFRSLCRHKQIHIGQKKYSCKYCGKQFFCPSRQQQHEKIHGTREKNFLCDICSKSFYSQGKLKCHQQIHEGKHILKCPVCDKLLKRNLAAHMMIHTGEKPFSCSECSMKFRSKSHLNAHKKTHQGTKQKHTGIRPFTCNVCWKSYGRQEHLKVHMRIHTGDKPYTCALCDRAFTQNSTLKTHMKIHQREQQSVTEALA